MKKNINLFIIALCVLFFSSIGLYGQIAKDSMVVTAKALDTTKFIILKQGTIETGIYTLICPIDDNMLSIPIKVYFDEAKKYIAFESIVNIDTVFTKEYSESGQLRMRKKYLKNIDLGEYVCIYQESYCENGQLICKSFENLWLFSQKKLEQHITNYYCNGKKRNEFTFVDGVFIGKYLTWHENGEKEMEGVFRNMEKTGKWKYWDSTGKLVKTEYYSNNQLQKVKNFKK